LGCTPFAFAQIACDNDTEAPDPICINGLTVEAIPDFGAVVWAEDFDAGTTDNCGLFQLTITTPTNNDGTPPTTSSITVPPELGFYPVVIYATDEAGNSDFCETFIEVTGTTSGDCAEDVTDPILACILELNVALSPITGSAIISAENLLVDVTDNCDPEPTLSANLASTSTGSPQGNSFVEFTSVGTYQVELWAVDNAGQSTACISNVIVQTIGTNCEDDTVPPVLACVNGITATLGVNGQATIWVEDVLLSFGDDCTEVPLLRVEPTEDSNGTPPVDQNVAFTDPGTYEVTAWVIDAAGNTSSCTTTITILGDPTDCDNDTTAPTIVCFAVIPVWAHPVNGAVVSPDIILVETSDACSAVTPLVELGSDFNDSSNATPSVVLPPQVGLYSVTTWAIDAAGNENACVTAVEVVGFYTPIEGQVFLDDNENCLLDGTEGDLGFGNWTIQATDEATGEVYTTTTDTDGTYELVIPVVPVGTTVPYTVAIVPPAGIATSCATTQSFALATEGATHDFPVQLAANCDYLTVDVSTPFLRRCFSNSYYLTYTNYSAQPVADARVTFQLDADMTFQFATQAHTDLGNGLLEFDLGTLAVAASGTIRVDVLLACTTPLGATHCVEAQIHPFTCTPASFAELVVTGDCDEETEEVRFLIKNQGNAAMLAAKNVGITEDIIMYMNTDDSPSVQLGVGEEETITLPANGATWRLEVEQDESFPFGGVATAFVEGCNGFSPGVATQFLVGSNKPNVTTDCQENIGAWDPNDKQAFPRGYGEQHYIKENTPLDYLIRFQNTGTDTAFNVVIEDQISTHLDWSTLRPGTSSHPYRYELSEDGLARFYFDDIMLPDSNVNEAASHGFVKFRIQQVTDNSVGTVLENTAAIYFDFNEPIITNTVTHTIGEDFVLVNTYTLHHPNLALSIHPHPLHTQAQLEITGHSPENAQLTLFDSHGRLVTKQAFSGASVTLHRASFSTTGLYFYRLTDDGQVLATGKLIVQ
ncbi:MAG: T9SS type A sorting domain-containing protein, partial [Bacteroidota bacterium]